MNDKFTTLLNRIKADHHIFSVDEAKTKQGSILPILSVLGWDVFDTNEVIPEYSVESKKVDYSLQIQGKNKVFLEAKKASEDLEKHQEQLLNYSFREGVRLAILTNGITWWFYLPLETGSWEQRKFFTVDLNEQAIEDCIEKFESLLSRANIESEVAYENAKLLFESRQKNKIIKENLPKAWKKLISEPDEMLVELLNETLEKSCGYKAEESQIIEFLRGKSSDEILTLPISKIRKNFVKEKVASVENQSKISDNLIIIDSQTLKDLYFTKIINGRFANDYAMNWRDVLNIGLRIAFEKGIGIDVLDQELNANFMLGEHKEKTYTPVKNTNFSMQNLSAPDTAKNILKLAKFLGCETYIVFEWQEKGKFPMKQGLIHWKP